MFPYLRFSAFFEVSLSLIANGNFAVSAERALDCQAGNIYLGRIVHKHKPHTVIIPLKDHQTRSLSSLAIASLGIPTPTPVFRCYSVGQDYRSSKVTLSKDPWPFSLSSSVAQLVRGPQLISLSFSRC